MKAFVCHRSVDKSDADRLLGDLFAQSNGSLVVVRETAHHEDWMQSASAQMASADVVLIMLTDQTLESSAIQWEIAEADALGKLVVGIALGEPDLHYLREKFKKPVFHSPSSLISYLSDCIAEERNLLIEQYKIMVGSTEKVTEQRLKVNNLFFTVTSSILSIAFLVSKAFEFDSFGLLAGVLLTGLAFVVTWFWGRLIRSYGTLNKGKFRVIDKLEKRLKTDMFSYEWEVLVNEVGYEANSVTEQKIVESFRVLIGLVLTFEIAFLIYQLLPFCNSL